MAKATHLRARKDSTEISLSHANTDSPLLDVNGIERLQNVRPDIVDFVVEETRKEAIHRRSKENTTNRYVFIERIGGLILSAFIALSGIFGGIYAALEGFEKLGISIVLACIGTLAVAFIRRK